MSEPGPAPGDEPGAAPEPAAEPERAARPPWGPGQVVAGYLFGLASSIVLGGVWIGLTGDQGLGLAAVSLVGLWVGLLGTPLWLSARRGSGSLARDFGLRFHWRDLPVGIACGLAVQIIAIPVLYTPLEHLFPSIDRQLAQPAKQLVSTAGSNLAFAFLALLVVIGAPVAEELFFRGLVLDVFRPRTGRLGAIAIAALTFALAHFEVVQFPALVVLGVVLGLLASSRRRLGPAIAAHAAFNAVTMVVLWQGR